MNAYAKDPFTEKSLRVRSAMSDVIITTMAEQLSID
jgi:hypothetical protein